MRRNIKQTFSQEGLEVDPEKTAIIARQFENNPSAYENKLEQERQKIIVTNLRRVNRSIGRLEKQNKNFLNQITSFRKDRVNIGKVSSTNIRALSGLQSRLMLSSHGPEKSQIEPGLNAALVGVSSVLRIGMDSKSQLDGMHTYNTGLSPDHDRSLNNTKTKFNFGGATAANRNDTATDLERTNQILIEEQQGDDPYQAA